MTLAGWSEPVTVTGTIDGAPATGALRVYVPAAPGKHPLVLALHGWNHTPEQWIKNDDLGPLAEKHGLVIAMPAMGKTVYETTLYAESKPTGLAAPGARWAAEVIVPWVRKHFAVTDETSVIGYSTGGRGAVLLARLYPDRFAFAGSVSGTFDLAKLQPADGEYKIHAAVFGPRERFPDRWARDDIAGHPLGTARLYAAHGAKDTAVHPNQLDALKDKAECVLVEGAAHDWAFWHAQWPAVFERLRRSR